MDATLNAPIPLYVAFHGLIRIMLNPNGITQAIKQFLGWWLNPISLVEVSNITLVLSIGLGAKCCIFS
jgi:hypothetical protein